MFSKLSKGQPHVSATNRVNKLFDLFRLRVLSLKVLSLENARICIVRGWVSMEED